MTVPTWYEMLLLTLASWRTWVLLARDDILNRPRRSVVEGQGVKPDRLRVESFIECPYCAGFWTALVWWGAWQLWPHAILAVAGAAAISALVPLIELLTD